MEQAAPTPAKLGYALRAIREARAFKPDIFFCGHLNMLPLAWFIARLCLIPLWLQIHGIDAWERPSRFAERLVTCATLVTSVSRYTRRRFLSWARLAPEMMAA